MSSEEIKAFWAALKPEERPRDGDGFAQALVAGGKLTKFQAQELQAGRGGGLVMGDYLLLAEIGAGGMGKVYKAQHRRMKRVVALKVMSSAAMQDDAAVKRFQREVEAAARLEHPNIVTAYDSGEAGKVKYLVMQFVDGGDLSDFVKKNGALPTEAAVGYVSQAAKGLAFAHAAGVVHRDIKPANLLLDKKGVVKILDMGLARIEDGDGLTATEQVMGTVDYMSPEQAAETKNADRRSDIYSLGCTLWYLLTAKKLYDGDTMISRLMKHRDAELPSLVKTRDDATWPLEQVFHKMIAKRPQDRYQSMDEVIAALEPFAPRGSSSGGGMGSSIGGDKAQSAELAQFMQAMAGGAANSSASVAAQAAKPATSTAVDATAAFSASEIGTDPKSRLHTRGSPPIGGATTGAAKTQGKAVRKKSPPVKLIAGGLLGAAVLIAGIIVTIKNKDGEVVAELNAPAGASVEFKPTAGTPIVASSKSPPAVATPASSILTGAQLATLLDAPEYRWSEPENLGGVNSSVNDRLVGVSVDESSLFLVRNGTQLMSTTRAGAGLPFRTPQPFPGGELFGISNGDVAISADGLTLALLRSSPNRVLLWGERRSASEPFSPLRELPQSQQLSAGHPAISADGLTLLAAAGGGEVYMWTRPSLGRPFEDAQRVPSPVSGREWDMPAYVSNDRLLMIVMGQIGEGAEQWRQARYFWRADVNSSFAAGKPLPVPLGAANGNSGNTSFLLSQDGQRIYFSSPAISGGLGGQDIFVTRRVLKNGSSPLPPTILGVSNPEVLGPNAPPPAVFPFDAQTAVNHQEAWAKHLGLPVEFTNDVGMKFRLIPPGEFQMGLGPEFSDEELKRLTSEKNDPIQKRLRSSRPAHPVRITRPFYMEVEEVTVGRYRDVVGQLRPEMETDPGKPLANYVTFADAITFCNKLSEREKKRPAYRMDGEQITLIDDADGYRLPTEAQWEFACRAGTNTFWYFGNDGGGAELTSDGDREFRRRCLAPNPFGLSALYAGSNEWCWDGTISAYEMPYSPAILSRRDDPREDVGPHRIKRGGANSDSGGAARRAINSFVRNSSPAAEANGGLTPYSGLGRVVLPIIGPDSATAARASTESVSQPPAAGVVYLDDLPEVEFRIFGNQGLGKHGKFREQAGVEREILFRGKPTAHTLWMHPPQLGSTTAFARYQLDGRFATFAAEAGIPDGVIDPRSPIEFRVLGDGRELWKSPALTKRGESAEVSVDIQGVKELRLEVSRGDKNGNCHAVWLMPRLTPAAAVIGAPSPATIPAEALEFAGRRYLLVDSFGNWLQAKAAAEALGGRLVCIESEAERNWLRDNIWKKRPIPVDSEKNLARIHLGGFQDKPGDPWRWLTGKLVDLKLWGGKGPNSPPGAISLNWMFDDAWDDSRQTDEYRYFVVEWDLLDATSTEASLDRQLARRLLDVKIPVRVTVAGKTIGIKPGATLPAEPFTLVGIDAGASYPVPPAELTMLLSDVRRLTSFNNTNLPTKDCDLWAETFAAMPSIMAVNASRCDELTDVGVAHLARLPKLEYANIGSSVKITSVGLAAFEKCKTLTTIELSEQAMAEGRFTLADIQKLQDALPKTRVVFSGVKPIPGLKPAAAK
jgi:formylglycine-generating enzyme required for sulfatase activity/tRNA A-37 threonylcarbamoyl transferase component Bud32